MAQEALERCLAERTRANTHIPDTANIIHFAHKHKPKRRSTLAQLAQHTLLEAREEMSFFGRRGEDGGKERGSAGGLGRRWGLCLEEEI